MKKQATVLLTLFALSLPLAAGAASHEHGDHKKAKAMDHGSHGMEAHGEMIMVGEAIVDGVKAMAHLNDVEEAMKKMGMDATHHLMVLFVDEKTGKPITEGVTAVKVTDPQGKTSGPIRLIGMDGHFGADIALQQKGEYSYEVGSKLPDGAKRTFEFKHALK